MKRLFTAILVSAALLVAIAGCGGEKPVAEDTFVKMYADLLVAQDSLGSGPEPTQKILAGLLKRYNVTGRQYAATLAYYNEEPKRWEVFFQKVIASLEAKRDANSRL